MNWDIVIASAGLGLIIAGFDHGPGQWARTGLKRLGWRIPRLLTCAPCASFWVGLMAGLLTGMPTMGVATTALSALFAGWCAVALVGRKGGCGK